MNEYKRKLYKRVLITLELSRMNKKGSSEEMLGFEKSKKVLIWQEVFIACFQVSHTAVRKAASDLRNASTMIEVKMSRKIHSRDSHMLTDKIIPLKTFRSIFSGNNRLWVSESVTANGWSQHNSDVLWTPATAQNCVFPTNMRQHWGSTAISRFIFFHWISLSALLMLLLTKTYSSEYHAKKPRKHIC